MAARSPLEAGRSRFVLQTLPNEDFPTMGAGDLPHQFADRRPGSCAA